MYIKTKDGREHNDTYNNFWNGTFEESGFNSMSAWEKSWKMHFRCKICPDAIGESVDIAHLTHGMVGLLKERTKVLME